jgi:hypothetical protein
MVDTNNIRDNKQEIEQAIAAIVNDVFRQGAEVHLHGDLQHADDQHTGVYASAFIHESSVTRTEQSQLENKGIYLVEQAAHITENPEMDDSLAEIPRDELADAAETDTELVLELDQRFIDTI